MPYITTINNQTSTIDISEEEQQHTITLDGVDYAIDWQQIAALAADPKESTNIGGHYSLIIGGTSYEIYARLLPKASGKDHQTYEIHVGDQRFEVKVEDERTRKLAGLVHAGAHTGTATIQAPMPGLVVNVLLEAGAQVEMGQAVVVLEAMKMENDLPTPITGTIKEVCVSKGQAVDQGQPLVIIEGAS